MKKIKKNRESAPKIRVHHRDKEVEMKEHLHALIDKKVVENKKGFNNKSKHEVRVFSS